MKQINLIVSMFLVSLLLFSLRAPVVMSSESRDTLLKEAQILYEADSRYVDARLQNQWKIIYSFQHPEYQKAISFEEFQYFGGHVAINYRADKNFMYNVSGIPRHPSVKDIKRNPIKKDPFLGVPIPPTYRFISNPLINITGHKFETVHVDDSGTLGKVAIRLNILEKLPPVARAGNIKIIRDILYVDYWEKINGKWTLAVMKQFSGFHISGAAYGVSEHPVPANASRWSAAHFTEFNPEDLK